MRDYKLVSEKPEAELFADLIRGSRDNRPTEGATGLMRPEDAPQQERSFMDRFFEYMGMNSDEPDRVAGAVANRTPSMTNFVEPEGELLNPWYSLVPIADFLTRDKTEEAIPTMSSMGAAPRMPTSAAIDFTAGAEPIEAPEISRVDDATFDRYTQATSAGSRELSDIEGVVLHYTHGSPGGSSLDSYMNVGFSRGVGAPIFIARDGTIHEVGDWRNSIIQHTSRSGGIGTYRAPSGERYSSANTVGIEIDVGWDWANDRPLEGEAGRPTEAQLEAVRRFTNSVVNEVNAVRPDDLQLDINRSVYAHPELGRKMPTEGTYALQWLREQEGLPATRDVEWYMDQSGEERIRINRSLVPRPRPTGEEASKQTTEKGEAGKQTTAKEEDTGDAFVVDAIDQILENEGGFQQDPNDSGNYVGNNLIGTNRGITPIALAEYRDVDVNTITVDDIRDLTEQEARAIYRQNFYERPRINELPANIRENVFDMYVNSYTNAIKILQRLAGVEEDGFIGPDTIAAVEEAGITNDDYSDAREAYYREVVRNDASQRRFLDGWINRANKYRD